MNATIPPIVSVDDHLVEPPDLWQSRLPSKFRDRAPRVVRSSYRLGGPLTAAARPEAYVMAADGPMTDFWLFEDTAKALTTGYAAVGQNMTETGLAPIPYDEMRPGCYDVDARLEDMDKAGIERSVCFPTVPRFCGQLFLEAKDKDLALACVQAYNDFMVEEWAGESDGRLIPLCLIPLWDAKLAAAEVRRNAGRGVTAVTFSELPSRLGLASIHDRTGWWDPFLRACDETGTAVCMHIGSSSATLTTSEDAPPGVAMALLTVNAQVSMIDWLLSGQLARFSHLKIVYSEAQIGWMPYAIEQADRVWEKGPSVTGLKFLDQPPSSFIPDRVFGCFFKDDFGVASRDVIGISQITLESDYPHQDSTWPDTGSVAGISGLRDDEIELIARGNAIRLFGLPDAL